MPFETYFSNEKSSDQKYRKQSLKRSARFFNTGNSDSGHPSSSFGLAWSRRRSSPAFARLSRLAPFTLKKASRHVSSPQWNGVCTVVRGIHARSRRSSAVPTMECCMSRSHGLPHGFPSGKSVKTNRATPHSSTTSRAEPMIAVGIPLSSRCRATRLTVWWHTGQSAERSTASTLSSRHHRDTCGA